MGDGEREDEGGGGFIDAGDRPEAPGGAEREREDDAGGEHGGELGGAGGGAHRDRSELLHEVRVERIRPGGPREARRTGFSIQERNRWDADWGTCRRGRRA